ncbi:hypothetical protein [Rhizobium leguminosarum]|uniref:hypothetical protein n=1 Tax=Rhizobium leguminosarum TaxID=384 RepID=UPI001AE21B5F|nr:hypothetical protein [Rhizobium leguminosarum]MBP2447645.1 hypothetical protein [Rhizobium leguminosarum]
MPSLIKRAAPTSPKDISELRTLMVGCLDDGAGISLRGTDSFPANRMKLHRFDLMAGGNDMRGDQSAKSEAERSRQLKVRLHPAIDKTSGPISGTTALHGLSLSSE